MKTQTLEFEGLDGTNPMGLLAGFGVLVVANRHDPAAQLGWADNVLPFARLHTTLSTSEVLHAIMQDRDDVVESTAFTHSFSEDDSPMSDVKFTTPAETAQWLEACHDASDKGLSESIASALVAEIAVDGKGKAKPTDLHFTAGQQKFLDMARDLAPAVDDASLDEALHGPWRYETQAPTFMWDVTDDRQYALSAVDPSSKKKETVPAADWLALRGLTLLPVVGRLGRAVTPGAHGTWKRGGFAWPLWEPGASAGEVRSLMALIPQRLDELEQWNPPTGVFRMLTCGITRSDQGGYGTFQSPNIIWTRTRSHA